MRKVTFQTLGASLLIVALVALTAHAQPALTNPPAPATPELAPPPATTATDLAPPVVTPPAATVATNAPPAPKAKPARRRGPVGYVGEVKTVDKVLMTLTVAKKRGERTFEVTSRTRFFKEGRPATFNQDVTEGEHVSVIGKKIKGGKFQAVTVRIGTKVTGATKAPAKKSKAHPAKKKKKKAPASTPPTTTDTTPAPDAGTAPATGAVTNPPPLPK